MANPQVAIIGAGLAGLACATALGRPAILFDKGRGPGGRMSSRRVATALGEASFDHGAQYFTVRDPAFRAQVAAWHAAGLVAPWPSAGPDRWVGTPTMSAPLKYLAGGLNVRWDTRIDAIEGEPGTWHLGGEGPFTTVLLAVPAENAAPLLTPAPAFAATARATPADPCWTVMAAFAERLLLPDTIRDHGPIGWAARNRSKPGRTGPEAWVIQAGPDWSRTHIEDPADTVVAALMAALNLPAPLTATAHRWRYAKSGTAGTDMLWDASVGIGVCGDWLLGPRVECAWLSGTRLGAAIP